jgi:RNA polymerase sigma-70 factor (ECF subfamily)
VSTGDESTLDARVAAHCQAGNHQAAASAILNALGADVLRVLHARFRDEQTTGEVFSRFAESLWVSLPAFEFRCSVRAWVFTLARNTGSRYLQRELRRERARVPLSRVPALALAVDGVRTQTLTALRTESRDLVERAKSQLAEVDQLILTLRVDRELSFRDIALVLLEDVHADETSVAREAARARKRFQLVKERLRLLLRGSRRGDEEPEL